MPTYDNIYSQLNELFNFSQEDIDNSRFVRNITANMGIVNKQPSA